ncbi:hypothetical protein K7X08_007271 [Anisodus acutangulus]|uniref:Uncharacterized protein n=1 Tax=Anisodus acutangulus TaxID=402998 RepID=A0A9Q1LFC4_9SOLA|nr:hypothetical protein K7X08_007271 [Anisodus acutangulus]
MSMDKHEVEASSPLATIEDIHKRLIRPLHSQLHELQHRSSSQSKSNLDTSLLQKRFVLRYRISYVRITARELFAIEFRYISNTEKEKIESC